MSRPESVPTGVEDLYGRACPRLIGLLTAMSGSRSDAEEIAQDAFLQAFRHWDTVRELDDPEAWVRRVAVRYLISRRRHSLAGLRARVRSGREPERGQPATADVVAVRNALTQIALDQRIVAVLFYVLDRSIEEIATELDIPAGTVKSRLARARSTLGELLDVDKEEIRHGG